MFKIYVMVLFLLFSHICGAELRIEIDNVRSAQGNLLITIYDNPLAYKTYSMEQAYAATMIKARKAVTSLSFNSLPEGDYVVIVSHDENLNGKMDFKAELPTEGYAFSQGQGRFSMPDFKKAALRVSGEKVIEKMQMIYLK